MPVLSNFYHSWKEGACHQYALGAVSPFAAAHKKAQTSQMAQSFGDLFSTLLAFVGLEVNAFYMADALINSFLVGKKNVFHHGINDSPVRLFYFA